MSKSISTGRLRRHLADTLNEARYAKRRIVIERNGRPVAAIVPMDDLDRLRKLEDSADAALADEAKSEGGSVSLSEARRQLKND